jgi:hypothetical protein
MARTGQRKVCPDRPRPTSSPRTLFFCLVNSSAMCVALSRSCSGQVNGFSRILLRSRCMSQMRNGAASWLSVDGYSPGRRRKKNPSVIICPMACSAGSVVA